MHKTVRYTAVDMQLGAIETCRKIHATPDNPNLTCKHSNGKSLDWVPTDSVDIVMITETHIAEMAIGDEEKVIFDNIIRMLKPGGIFVWGNALPTKVWHDAYEHLEGVGFSPCQGKGDGKFNHTQSAITARDEDTDRVNLYVEQAMDTFPVLRMPFGPGKKCRHVCDRLLKNFYRHPGTDLYQRMVVGHDSYMHLCYRLADDKGAAAAAAE